jgi:protein-S-isoprenylcysteine O-methyltransferase Ste14
LALARPSWVSWQLGVIVALAGEALRIWAAGHIDKGREVTSSGPYRFLRHPLYAGSTLVGIGFAIAAQSAIVAAIAAAYLALTLFAAMRTEEAALDARFGGAYAAYREGRASPVSRRFSVTRAVGNREYRALAGVALAFVWLAFRVP